VLVVEVITGSGDEFVECVVMGLERGLDFFVGGLMSEVTETDPGVVAGPVLDRQG
jgi:hypothetical protein